MKQYCEKNGIKIDNRFHEVEIAKISIIDRSIEQRPLLLHHTFTREIDAFRYLKEENKHPANYQVLNFKTGKEYQLQISEKPVMVGTFDKQEDADPVYGENA